MVSFFLLLSLAYVNERTQSVYDFKGKQQDAHKQNLEPRLN